MIDLTPMKERRGKEPEDRSDARSEYSRDKARIVHSFAFRRLQSKTQVVGISESDFHRTRLTHSLEVAQLCTGIVCFLKSRYPEHAGIFPEQDCIEAIGLAHDMGHPPFGHSGERALNKSMKDWGGFEGNGHTLRLLTVLEGHTSGHGLNLTRRILLGVLKYPVPYSWVNNPGCLKSPPKCYHDSEKVYVDWVLEAFSGGDRKKFVEFHSATEHKHGKRKYHSFDTSIMELADDISYGVFDLEDAIAFGIIKRQDFESDNKGFKSIRENMPELEEHFQGMFAEKAGKRKRSTGAIANTLVNSIKIKEIDGFEHPLLRYNAFLPEKEAGLLASLKDLTRRHVIQNNNLRTLEYRGNHMIEKILKVLFSDPVSFLPAMQSKIHKSRKTEDEKARVVCDYIAGMTDPYASRFYERLFIPDRGSILEML